MLQQRQYAIHELKNNFENDQQLAKINVCEIMTLRVIEQN